MQLKCSIVTTPIKSKIKAATHRLHLTFHHYLKPLKTISYPAMIIRKTLILFLVLFINSSITSAESLNVDEISANTKTNEQKPTIVIILDDMGNNLALGEQALALPGAINYSFLPHSNSTRTLATKAHLQGKEVLVHAPMSNLSNQALGPGGLTPAMNKEQFLQTLREDLQAVPHAKGLNNHMGSLLTQLREPMMWLAKELKQQDMYFIDSRTSPLTVAEQMTKHYYIPTLKRDIFLDNERDMQAIAEQFEKLIQLAERRGLAIAIGHPYPETLDYLKQVLPTLDDRGIQLSLASQVINKEFNQ
jgi:polysaccharide deacetylase 2 family uncharacterized protein YibQ